MSDLANSTLVVMTDMPDGTEPAWIWKAMLSDFGDSVKEIEDAFDFYVHMDSPANAQAVATRYDGTGCGEKSHLYKKAISVKVVPMTDAPEPERVRLRLTDFLRTQAAMPRTKTVRVSGLPRGHPKAAVLQMCDQIIEGWNVNDDPQLGPLTKDICPSVVHVEIDTWSDDAFVRFSSCEVANEMVGEFNGGFWKNATTYAVCVQDSEMDDMIVETSKQQGPTAKLFIGGLKAGTSTNDIRDLFHPHVPKDIHIPPGAARIAFVFLPRDAAEKFLNDNPNGKRHNGWNYHVKYADKGAKGKARGKALAPSGPAVNTFADVDTLAAGVKHTVVFGTGDHINLGGATNTPATVFGVVRLSGLAFTTTAEHVRDFCEKLDIHPEDVEIEKGQATFKVAGTQEAENAALMLNQKKIQKRKVVAVKLD